MNDVLHFLNKLDFVSDLESGEYKKFNCIEKVLTDEFQDVSSEKLINMLGVLDDLHILFITQNFQDVRILTNELLEFIFLPLKEKMEDE